MSPPRIAAVVMNSVSHDARVLKEADSLAEAGYEVAIFGIQDNRCSDPVTHRASGVVIRRCDWKPAAHRAVARGFLLAGIATVLVVLALYAAVFDWLYTRVEVRTLVFSFGAVVILLGLAPFLRQHARYHAIARRLEPDSVATTTAKDAAPPRLAALVDKARSVTFRVARERRLLAMLAEFAPAAVHCHDLTALPVGCRHARRSGCRIVYDSHEIYEELSLATPAQKRLSRIRQRRHSGSVDAFVTINDSIAEYLGRAYPRLPEAVIVKNATLPLERPEPYDGRLHEAADLDAERRILLYQGGFARFRGLDALVRAGALLPPRWCLVMMGWGAFEATLRDIARAVDSEGDRVRFVPPAPHHDLVRWTAGGSLGVIPYENVCLNHWYCSPNKLWEYPNAGVPILASPFPELRRAIEEHGIGRLLGDPPTPSSIAAAVAAVTDEELAEMRRCCRRYIERDNWSVYERRLVDLYRGLLGAAGRADGDAPRPAAERVGEESDPIAVAPGR